MDRFDAPPLLTLVSDLDYTMVDHHDPNNLALLRFNALWESTYRHHSLLVFSTGRSRVLYEALREVEKKPILTPDVTIMSVGTEIAYGEDMVPDAGWEDALDRGWDKGVVLEECALFPQIRLQADSEQRPHKASFYIQKGKADEVIGPLAERLEKRGLDVKLIFSGGQDLDVLPRGAGKGQALDYLLKKLKREGKAPVNTLACGDSGNDAELFTIAEVHGVMVSNAQSELLKWYEGNAKNNPKVIHATERCAAGIIQAIGHFGLGPNTSPRDVPDLSNFKLNTFSPGAELVKFYLFYERWLRAEVENSGHLIQSMKQSMTSTGIIVHPSGSERPLYKSLKSLEACYGKKQGKDFRVWIDRVSSSQIGSDSWLVRFDKWELSEGIKRGSLNTALLCIKPESTSGFVIAHIHQTWMVGNAGSDPISWIF